MAYAQINYPQLQGMRNPSNGVMPRYTIHDIGCFLTAFCNLESLRYGHDVNPLDLNNIFANSGVWIDVDDGVLDDLGWESISRYDGAIHVSRTIDHGTGQTAGLPSSREAIVKFAYTSPRTGHFSTHFALYDGDGYIIDSWDGVRKLISSTWYGNPVAYAEYSKVAAPVPQPVTPPAPEIRVTPYASPKQMIVSAGHKKWNLDQPDFNAIAANPVGDAPTTAVAIAAYLTRSDLPNYIYLLEDANVHQGYNSLDCTDYVAPPPYVPPAAPVPFPGAEQFKLVTSVQGYGSASDARQGLSTTEPVAPGDYYVYATNQGMSNITKSAAKEGIWINPADNIEGKDVTSPVPSRITEVVKEAAELIPRPTIEVLPPVPADNTWKKMIPLRVDRQAVKYIGRNTRTVMIHDFEGRDVDIPMSAFKEVWVAGTFIAPDGSKYYRTAGSVKQGRWYGIPVTLLQKETIFNYATTLAERVYEGTTKLGDRPAIVFGKAHKFIDGIKQTLARRQQ